jgi:hypothetical protein
MMRTMAALVLVMTDPVSISAAGRPGNMRVAGPLRQSIERDALRMARQSPGAVVPQASRRSWARRHPVALGMRIGLAAGVTVGASQEYEGKRPFGPQVALQARVGRGVGAGLGAIVSIANRRLGASTQTALKRNGRLDPGATATAGCRTIQWAPRSGHSP